VERRELVAKEWKFPAFRKVERRLLLERHAIVFVASVAVGVGLRMIGVPREITRATFGILNAFAPSVIARIRPGRRRGALRKLAGDPARILHLAQRDDGELVRMSGVIRGPARTEDQAPDAPVWDRRRDGDHLVEVMVDFIVDDESGASAWVDVSGARVVLLGEDRRHFSLRVGDRVDIVGRKDRGMHRLGAQGLRRDEPEIVLLRAGAKLPLLIIFDETRDRALAAAPSPLALPPAS